MEVANNYLTVFQLTLHYIPDDKFWAVIIKIYRDQGMSYKQADTRYFLSSWVKYSLSVTDPLTSLPPSSQMTDLSSSYPPSSARDFYRPSLYTKRNFFHCTFTRKIIPYLFILQLNNRHRLYLFFLL